MDTLTPLADDEYERYLKEQISRIHAEARSAAEPYVKLLVRLQMMRPPAPFFLTAEQARALKFPGHD